MNLSFQWSPNPNWTTYPGSGPTAYAIDRNTTPTATILSNYPATESWDADASLADGEIVKYDISAIFTGALRSALLTLHFKCVAPNVQYITATPTDTPAP